MDRGQRVRRSLFSVAVLMSLFTAGDALAQTPPGDISGVDQYTEPRPPSGSGNQPTRPGAGNQPTGPGAGNQPTRPGAGNQTGGTVGGKPRPLPPSVTRELRERGGSDAALLEALATSPSLGAPGAGLRRSSDGRSGVSAGNDRAKDRDGSGGRRNGGGNRGATSDGSGVPEGLRDVSFGGAISSAVGALADTEGGGGPSPLLLALLAISTALISAAVWRARRNRA